MSVAIATVRLRLRLGPALGRAPVPLAGLVLSGLIHGALIAIIVLAGHAWRSSQPKAYIVNLVPAIPGPGSPQGRARVPEPTLPRWSDLPVPRPTPTPALPEREPTRTPERPARPTDLPDRTPVPRDSLALPDRTLPSRTPALPRPGEKELPRVASATPPAVPGRTGAPPPVPLGRANGSPQGVGALTVNAADFPFAWYLRAVNDKISKNWDGKARDGIQPTVVFEIGRNGQVRALSVEKTSGNPAYDQAALRAIADANPFPQLPPEFTEPFLRVHLGFNYTGSRG